MTPKTISSGWLYSHQACAKSINFACQNTSRWQIFLKVLTKIYWSHKNARKVLVASSCSNEWKMHEALTNSDSSETVRRKVIKKLKLFPLAQQNNSNFYSHKHSDRERSKIIYELSSFLFKARSPKIPLVFVLCESRIMFVDEFSFKIFSTTISIFLSKRTRRRPFKKTEENNWNFYRQKKGASCC